MRLHAGGSTTLWTSMLIGIALSVPAQAAWVEDFSLVADETPLENLPGWTADVGSATVRTSAGYTDQGIYQTSGWYTRTLDASEQVTASDTEIAFSLTWKLDYSDDRFSGVEFRLGNDGGANAFRVEFFSGAQKDPTNNDWSQRDNRVRISAGGTEADPIWETYESGDGRAGAGRWLAQRWYTLTITDIDLTTGTGTVNLFETDNVSTVKIANAVITATSGGNPFDTIDYFSFNEISSNNRPVYIDNISLTAVPEPASLALLGMAGAVVSLRRRR